MSNKRKLVMFLLQLFAGTIVVLGGKMTGAEFVDLEKAAMLYFAGANALEHFAGKSKAGPA